MSEIYENNWSPFLPEWYEEAFEKYISTDHQLFNQDEIIKMGFTIPDVDGSRSSVFRNSAILNNSFDENKLRDTLKDIYINQSSKLRAMNHDNVHYYQYHTSMHKINVDESKYIGMIELLTDTFIQSKGRNKFKLSQFYDKWISINDIMNNDVFDWTFLLFIDGRIYSDYEIKINEQEMLVRFKYEKFWYNRDYSIDIYKFDTNYKKRIKITKYLLTKEWNYKIPIDFIDNNFNQSNVILTFNRNTINRLDNVEDIDILGDNMEFISNDNGILDLSSISKINKIMIESEDNDYIWMGIISPKFFNEYPILLPVENIYREYQPNLVKVYTTHLGSFSSVKDTDKSQLYIDIDDCVPKEEDLWKTMIRPIVLSDAYNSKADDPYNTMDEFITPLKQSIVELADLTEEFRFFLKKDKDDNNLLEFLNKFISICKHVKSSYDDFRIHVKLPINIDYDLKHKSFIEEIIPDIISNKYSSSYINSGKNNFFSLVSPLIHIPQTLSDKYNLSNIIKSMKKKVLWNTDDKYKDKLRFSRPVDISDFMIFEYNIEKQSWFPSDVKIEYHFPDVYILSDDNKNIENRIFKAFIFYSDTINVKKESVDIIKPSTYDKDMELYEYDKDGVFRNIFMEKFYWLAIKSIYSGSLRTESRWELIEYSINNPTYKRFNNLFINTMEPYFKAGMANYIKNKNFLFTFDYLVNKMSESIKQQMMKYDRITNYQIYLNKTWKPSYFDYKVDIDNNWDPKDRLIRRPPVSFDINRLLKILKEIEENVSKNGNDIKLNLDFVLSKFRSEIYGLDRNEYPISTEQFYDYTGIRLDEVDNIKEELISVEMFDNLFDITDDGIFINSYIGVKNLYHLINKIIDFNSKLNNSIMEFDLDIYSIEDTEKVLDSLKWYSSVMNNFKRVMRIVYDDTDKKAKSNAKRKLLIDIKGNFDNNVKLYINKLSEMIQTFDMNEFMRVTNNLDTLKNSFKINDDDISLIGEINKFGDTKANEKIKDTRNRLFISTTELNSLFNSNKSYSYNELIEFVNKVNTVISDIQELRSALNNFWKDSLSDINIVNKLDNSEAMITKLGRYCNKYMELYNTMNKHISDIQILLEEIQRMPLSDTELDFIKSINLDFGSVISNLSYINGVNKKGEAMISYNRFIITLNSWHDFIQVEEEVYTKILDNTKLPSPMTDLIEEYSALLGAIGICLKHLGDFKPDTEQPSLINVYQPLTVEMTNGGFRNKSGNIAFVPNLGSFRITKVGGDINSCTEFNTINYRNTMFRNPLVQELPYPSITNGYGLDIKFRPIDVKTIPIINDDVLEKYIRISTGIVGLIRESLPIINYSDNGLLSRSISRIEKMKEEWEDLKSFYNDHMSDKKIQIDILIRLMEKLKDPINGYMDDRFNINIYRLLTNLESFVLASYKYHRERNILDGNYFLYDDAVRVSFNTLFSFYSSRSNWKDSSRLINILDNIKLKLSRFNKFILSKSNDPNLNNLYESLQNYISDILSYVKGLTQKRKDIRVDLFNIDNMLKKLSNGFHKDEWHRIVKCNVSAGGENYSQGDIIEMIPELPLDLQGNVIKDQEDLIMNDVLLFQVTRVDDKGSVMKVKPFMDYALPYKIYGTRQTSSRITKANGCIISIKTELVNYDKSYLFQENSDNINRIPKFNDTDLFKFKFENIHDLPLEYEVFFGGLQTDDFIFRHMKDDDTEKTPNNHLNPSKYDAIYVRANDIMELNNSSLEIKSDHYIKYKIDSIDIVDPGAGYYEGQEIYVDTGKNTIKLIVKELDGTPLKGIKSIDFENVISVFERIDPSCENAKVVTDTINNIDDEFNDSYYDSLPKEGIEKRLTFSHDISKYSFIAKRFDNLNQYRNSYYMNSHIIGNDKIPKDDTRYIGSRVNEKRKWESMKNVVPTYYESDTVLFPGNSSLTPEYQFIKRERLHNSSDELTVKEISAISDDRIKEIIENFDTDYNARQTDDLIINKTKIARIDESAIYPVVRELRQPRRSSMFSQRFNDELLTIRPIEEDRITGIIDGTILPTSSEVYRFYEARSLSTNVNEVFEFTLKNSAMVEPDLKVKRYSDLPKHINDWKDAVVGKLVVVENDENHNNHRMVYRLRSMIVSGYFVYDKPEVADIKWNTFKINWMENDSYNDFPSLKTQYPSDIWRSSKTFIGIEKMISDGKIEKVVRPVSNKTAFIHNITMEDLAVYNYTKRRWEDLQNFSKWRLRTHEDPKGNKWGFELSYINDKDVYSYDMALFLIKSPKSQLRNSKLKKNAILNIKASMIDEVETKSDMISINTGRDLRIRKLFPYEQKDKFTLNDKNHIMNIKIKNYLHFRNELHLEDVKIFNKTSNRYEDIFDNTLFEVQFKSLAFNTIETNTKIIRSMISKIGSGFYDGTVYGWNPEYNLYIFGDIITDKSSGSIERFIPKNCNNAPKEDRTLEFFLYQHDLQTEEEMGRVLVEFKTSKEEVHSDGYIHNVSNRLSPLPKEFRIICKYDLLSTNEYEVIISKSPKVWSFIENKWKMVPTFTIKNENIPFDRIYATVQGKGRFPLINPSTLRPTLNVKETDNGTDITFLNLYRANEKFEIHLLPYPIRSVYTQRRVPSHGYINLKGKINKPLDKKYFEFWMNGRLLDKEVSIITPTKLILHGLKSLRNFEIIEINRDSNEYFSDLFLNKSNNSLKPEWNLNTYLDDVLENNLKDDNFRDREKAALLYPIWEQVEKSHPEFKNYPPNSDTEPDILQRVYEEDLPFNQNIPSPAYQFLVTDIPTIQGNPLGSRSLTFNNLGFRPYTEDELIEMMNEEWKDEIDKGIINIHSPIADDAWYGMLVRLYDENGNEVNRLTEAVYKIIDTNLIKINTDNKISNIIKNKLVYDLD